MKKIVNKLKLFTPSIVLIYKDDEVLMELVKIESNEQAFRVLVERYKNRVISYLNTFKLEHSVREELTQESFLKIFRYRENYKVGERFAPWLWTVARNTALDYLRKKKELLYNDFKQSEEVSELFDSNIESNESSPEEMLIERVEADQIKKCFNGLKPAQREILQARLYLDLSYEELMSQFGKSMAFVKNQIHRAKKGLIACLKECLNE